LEYILVSDSEKIKLRDKFIRNFINTEHEHYKRHIVTLKEDYLWAVLNEPYDLVVKKQENALAYLKQKETVLVMWDIHHKNGLNDKIRLNNPQDAIISVKTDELCELIEYEWNTDYNSENRYTTFLANRYLPEDIYIFDDTMKWCVIFTHEGDDNFTNPELSEDDYIRICFVIDRAKEETGKLNLVPITLEGI